MKRSHRGKDKFKVQVEILVKKVSGLQASNGNPVYINWRRGTDKNKGDTKRVVVKSSGDAEWVGEAIRFESKLFIDPVSGRVDEKKLSLSLKEDSKKKGLGKTVAKASINLGQYYDNGRGTAIAQIPLVSATDKKAAIVLVTSFSFKPMKFNDKDIAKVGSKSTSEDPRLVKSINGQDYFLDRTDSDPSQTTMDTKSIASDADTLDNKNVFDDLSHDDDDEGPAKQELIGRIEELEQQIDMLESEGFERLGTIREKEKEITRLKADLKDRDSTIDKVLKEKEDLIKGGGGKKGAGGGDAAQILELEKEVEKLKRELRTASSKSTAPVEDTSLRSRVDQLTRENDEKTREIAKLNKLLKEGAAAAAMASSSSSSSRNNNNGRGGGSRYDDTDDVIGDEYDQKGKGGSGKNSTKSPPSSSSSSSGRGRSDSDGGGGGGGSASRAVKQELEEKVLLENTIYAGEPQFKSNVPVSAAAIYDALMTWESLRDTKDGGRVLASISAGLESACKRSSKDNAMLCYWLSTTCYLLGKIKKKVDSDDASDSSPVTRFLTTMTTSIFKVYSRILKNVYTQLTPVLSAVVLNPSVALSSSSSSLSSSTSSQLVTSHTPTSTASNPEASVLGAWVSMATILHVLQDTNETMQAAFVPAPLVGQFFTQLFYWISAQLFNSLSHHPELCTCAHGFQIRLRVSQIEEWVAKEGGQDILSCRDQLAPIIQAANLLVMEKKLLGDPSVLLEACPTLNPAQIKHILTQYSPDRLSSEIVPSAVQRSLDDMIAKTKAKQGDEGVVLEMDPQHMLRLSLGFLGEKSGSSSSSSSSSSGGGGGSFKRSGSTK